MTGRKTNPASKASDRFQLTSGAVLQLPLHELIKMLSPVLPRAENKKPEDHEPSPFMANRRRIASQDESNSATIRSVNRKKPSDEPNR